MLEQLLAFTETAKRGSFAAAARELGTTPSAAAKAVARLESSLGLRLFHRTTRHVALTSDGERLFNRYQRLLAELEEIQAEALGASTQPRGTLRVDLPIVLGRQLVLPILSRLMCQYPELRLDVRLSDAFVDVVSDSVDLAVRIGTLPDSSLVARKIASQDWLLCASPLYLEKAGTPATLGALALHEGILFRMPSTGRDLVWQLREDGADHAISPPSRIRCSDGEAMVQFAEAGHGIAQLPDYMVRGALGEGRLVELLPQCRPKSTPIYAVTAGNRLLPGRVRALLAELEKLAC